MFRELGRQAPISGEVPDVVTDPEEIRFLLEDLEREALIVLDELDRVEDDDALSMLADTVKTLSDHGTGVTLMFVGVAASVEQLLGEHESIVRNVRQIPKACLTSPISSDSAPAAKRSTMTGCWWRGTTLSAPRQARFARTPCSVNTDGQPTARSQGISSSSHS